MQKENFIMSVLRVVFISDLISFLSRLFWKRKYSWLVNFVVLVPCLFLSYPFWVSDGLGAGIFFLCITYTMFCVTTWGILFEKHRKNSELGSHDECTWVNMSVGKPIVYDEHGKIIW